MVCSITCFVSIMFLVAMIYCNVASYNNKTIINYRNQLPTNLKNLYDKIVIERLKIYYQGYILGLIISLFIIIYNYQFKTDKLSLLSIVCIVLSTSFITNYFYYILHPKTEWMLDNITDPSQVKVWLNMYKHMQGYYHTGLLLGLISIIVLAIAFRC